MFFRKANYENNSLHYCKICSSKYCHYFCGKLIPFSCYPVKMLQPTTTVPHFKYRLFKFFLQQVHITVVFKSTNAPMRLREDNPQFIQIYRYITYKTIFVCLFWANTMWQLIRALNSHTWTTPSTYTTITRKL